MDETCGQKWLRLIQRHYPELAIAYTESDSDFVGGDSMPTWSEEYWKFAVVRERHGWDIYVCSAGTGPKEDLDTRDRTFIATAKLMGLLE